MIPDTLFFVLQGGTQKLRLDVKTIRFVSTVKISRPKNLTNSFIRGRKTTNLFDEMMFCFLMMVQDGFHCGYFDIFC